MIHAYSELYLDEAMINLADMLEYAVLDLNYESDAFFKMFIDSGVSRRFEIGDASIIAGKSGPEIAVLVLDSEAPHEAYPAPSWREDRSDVFWAGWVLAFFQWYVNRPFSDIWESISIRKILKLYPTLHEADITKTVDVMERMLKKKESRSVHSLRISRGWSQAQLADLAGMTVSQLQRLEYGERKTDNLTLKSAIALAKALGVDPEVLLSKDEHE